MKKNAYLAAMIAAVFLLGVPPTFAAQSTKTQKAQLFLKGAKLWPIYCGQCHKARPGSEFSPADWDTIMMHMRSRANLPDDDAEAILAYLKAR